MDHDLAILTPSKTIVTFRLAGIGSRVLAQILDIVLILTLLLGINASMVALLARLEPGFALGLAAISSVLLPLAYFILFEGLANGVTPGKRSASIRVRMQDGTPVTFAAALARNLLRPADLLPGPYFVGLIAIFTNPRSQRIGDLVAGTVVCQDRRPILDFTPAPHAVGIHPLEDQVGDLRGMTLDEYQALRRLADRWPELPGEAQARLLREVYRPIAERRKIPEDRNLNPIFTVEAVVMKYGRTRGLL